MTSTTTTTANHLDAKNAVDSLFASFCDSAPINEQDLSLSFAGIEDKSLQIRDYVFGLVGLNLSDSVDRYRFLNLFTVCGESAHVHAMRGAYLYEEGKIEEALEELYKAPLNSLARLLVRSIRSGLPAEIFTSMREELHPKVIEGLLGEYANQPIKNA